MAMRCIAAVAACSILVGATTATSAALGGAATASPRWERTATHIDDVPAWVKDAAAAITIAVVDTGADVSSPSISAKAPLTFSVATGSAAVTDRVGHGTFVASLAAGSAASGGMEGFGGQARLMVVKADRRTASFSDADEARAIVWAVDHGARVVNLSLAGTTTSPVERAAIRYAVHHGALLVAAAGNTGVEGNARTFPASLLGKSGLVVGAATPAGSRAPFSTALPQLDVLAPGVDVLGELPSLAAPRYGLGSGTSYAAPQVAGAAALVWAANPALTAADVAAIITETAAGAGKWTETDGFGMVDIAAAVARAQRSSASSFLRAA
jgi:subtilisin family serine protease